MKMQKSLFLTIAIFLITLTTSAQEKIATGTYLYGNLKNALQGNILLCYDIDDPKGESFALKLLKDQGYNVVNWNSLFLPGQEYTEVEKDKIIAQKNIETTLIVKIKDTETHLQDNISTDYHTSTSEDIVTKEKTTKKSVTTSTSTNEIIDKVTIIIELYSKDQGDKAVAVINSETRSFFQLTLSQQNLLVNKMVKRVFIKMIKLNTQK